MVHSVPGAGWDVCVKKEVRLEKGHNILRRFDRKKPISKKEADLRIFLEK